MRPIHPDNARHLATLREVVRINEHIQELQAERVSLLEGLPCGRYDVPNEGELEVQLRRSARISTQLLAGHLDRQAINACRVHGPYRKVVKRVNAVNAD